MFNNGKSDDEISTWTATIEGHISEGDTIITKLTKCINDLKVEELRLKEAENLVQSKERKEQLEQKPESKNGNEIQQVQ